MMYNANGGDKRMKIKVCGPASARQVVMKRAWKEIKETEAKGQFADFRAVVNKYWKPIKEKLAKKECFDEEV